MTSPRTRCATSVAAETPGAYDTGRRAEARLADLGAAFERRDRDMGEIVQTLLRLRADGAWAELLDGVSPQVWLEHHGRLAAKDARAVLAAVDVLVHMPRFAQSLCERWVSWSQTSAICRAARTVPVRELSGLDLLVADAAIDLADVAPDTLVQLVYGWVDALRPSRLEQAEQAAERGEFVSLSPNLFGGGSMYGEFGTTSFATVTEALHAPLDPPHAVPDDLDDETAEELLDSLDDQRRARTRRHGAAMAQRLVGLCEADLAGRTTDGHSTPARPLLLATIDADSLLDTDRTPGWLLHTLTGGRMKVSASLLQRLTDERGADLRTIVLDDCGQVVGVGRTTYVPPTWLRQAIWARDTQVVDPDRRCPIRRADLDHRVEFPRGPTDVSNLDPLGRSWHNRKTSKAWTTTRARDGTVEWRHRRLGWRLKLGPPHPDFTKPPRAGPPTLDLDPLVDERAGPAEREP